MKPGAWTAAGLAALGSAVGIYTLRIEPRWLRITHLRLAVPDLPLAFDGYRITHVTDLHLGVALNDRRLPDLVRTINAQQGDLIALTGDFATGNTTPLSQVIGPLRDLRAPDGAWGCMGNHDYYLGVQPIRAALDGVGIDLLFNAHTVVRRGDAALVIAGVDDVLRGRPDLNAALDGAPAAAPVVLLAHEPDYARTAAAYPQVTLQLSGHTHGGQVRLPGVGALILPGLGHVYTAGTFQIGRLALFVSRGVGTGRLTVRLNCRPEIAVITLVRGESADGPAA